MKYIIPILLIALVSCKKQVTTTETSEITYLQKVKTYLNANLTAVSPSKLNYSEASKLKKTGTEDKLIFKVPVTANATSGINEFIILQTDLSGTVSSGEFIQLSKASNGTYLAFSGDITVRDLKGIIKKQVNIPAGNVALNPPDPNNPPPPGGGTGGVWLDEVLVIGYRNGSGLSFAQYYLLQGLSYGSSSDEISGYYVATGGGGNGDSDGDGFPDGVEIEAEYVYEDPAEDLEKLFKCFDNIPNDGATYQIRLNTDVPSNNHPDRILSANRGGGFGHVFLTITKANEDMFVTQTFGFYMGQSLNFWDPFAPVTSKIVNNGNREVNASIQMSMTQAQFETVKEKANAFAHNNYDLGSYNCASYALDVFNSIRPNPIVTQVIDFDFVPPAALLYPAIHEVIYNSPQALYKKLKEMKDAGGAEAGRINIQPNHSTKARTSSGPCE